jgi:hypothetical protein
MARFFKPKRRRTNTGPNKNESKVLRRERIERDKGTAVTLGDLFPSIRRLSLDIRFMTPQNQPFEEFKRTMEAGDPCDLILNCPGRCDVGRFDLSERVGAMVQTRRERSDEKLICPQPIYAGPAGSCDFRLECRVDLVLADE